MASEKLSRPRYGEEFLRLDTRALLVVQNFGVVGAFVGEELQQQFASWQRAATEPARSSPQGSAATRDSGLLRPRYPASSPRPGGPAPRRRSGVGAAHRPAGA